MSDPASSPLAGRIALVTGANSGKTELKHSIYGGKDGSHLFNIRVTALVQCSVLSPDVVVGKEGQ